MTSDSAVERTETLMGWPPLPPYACWMELAHSSPTARSRLGCSCLGTPWPISSSRSHLRSRRRCSASLVMEKVLPVAFEVIGACSPAATSAFGVDEHGQTHHSMGPRRARQTSCRTRPPAEPERGQPLATDSALNLITISRVPLRDQAITTRDSPGDAGRSERQHPVPLSGPAEALALAR